MGKARGLPKEEIRAMRRAGASIKEIARRYSASAASIRYLLKDRPAASAPVYPVRISIKKPAGPTKAKKCLKCREKVELPKELFLCERCRKFAEAHGWW